MRFKIGNFYHDKSYGVLKFEGYKDGNLIYSQWEKSFATRGKYSGWLTTGQRVNIDPKFQEQRVKNKSIRPILPPE
jgi:hypothetical protein